MCSPWKKSLHQCHLAITSLAWILQWIPEWWCWVSCQLHLLSHHSLIHGRNWVTSYVAKLRRNRSQAQGIFTSKLLGKWKRFFHAFMYSRMLCSYTSGWASSNQQMHDLFWNGAEFSIILLYIEITHGCR